MLDPKHTHILNPRVLWICHFTREGEIMVPYAVNCSSADLGVGGLSWVTVWAQGNPQGPYGGSLWEKAGEPDQGHGEIWRSYTSGFEDGDRVHMPGNTGSFQKWKKIQRKDSFSRLQKEHNPVDILRLAQWVTPLSGSAHQNCRIINVCGFKALVLW